MGVPSKEIANTPLNDQADSCVTVTCPSTKKLVLFDPQNAELVVCDSSAANALRQEAQDLNDFLGKLHKARMELGEALKKIDEVGHEGGPLSDSLYEQLKGKVAEKIDPTQKARDALLGALSKIVGKQKTDKLVELLPMFEPGQEKTLGGSKFLYARGSKVDIDNRGKFRRHPLKKKGRAAKSMQEFMLHDAGQWQINEAKFQAALNDAYAEMTEKENIVDAKAAAAWAPDFVKGFNQNANFKAHYKLSYAEVAFSGEAHLLRFYAGASMHGEDHLSAQDFVSVLSGNGSYGVSYKAQGELNAELASGSVSADLFLPGKQGLHLAYEEFDLGYFRLDIKGGLDAYCGASVMAAGGVQLMVTADKSQQGMRGLALNETANGLVQPSLEVKVEAGAQVDAEAFAGAAAGASIRGAFMWQKIKSEEFAEFASIEPKLTGQAGAGAAACFSVTYDGGRFVIKAKLGACVGLGLKGQIHASIGTGNIAEFAKWFCYQVANAGVQNLKYFAKDEDFELFNKMCAWVVLSGEELADQIGKSLDTLQQNLQNWEADFEALSEYVIDSVSDWFGDDSSELSLLEVVPEVRGIVLHYLMKQYDELKEQISTASWWAEEKMELLLDALQEAIEKIFDSCYQLADLENTLQHTNADGSKNAPSATSSIEQRVMQIADVDFYELRARLKTAPTPGYPIVPNTSSTYIAQNGVYPSWEKRRNIV